MSYISTILSVKDINVSRRFYEELFGLRVKLDFGANVMFDCGLSLQQGYAGLIGISPDDVVYKPNNSELYFEEDDFDRFVRTLKERPLLSLVHDVKEHGWGQRVIRFYDPDGHIIEVGESMEHVVTRFLQQGLTVQETASRTQFPVEFVQKCQRSGEAI